MSNTRILIWVSDSDEFVGLGYNFALAHIAPETAREFLGRMDIVKAAGMWRATYLESFCQFLSDDEDGTLLALYEENGGEAISPERAAVMLPEGALSDTAPFEPVSWGDEGPQAAPLCGHVTHVYDDEVTFEADAKHSPHTVWTSEIPRAVLEQIAGPAPERAPAVRPSYLKPGALLPTPEVMEAIRTVAGRKRPHVKIEVRGGVADYEVEGDVDVELIDHDTDEEADGYEG